MAIKVNGTTVIDDSRNLSNVGGLKTVNGTSLVGSGNISAGASTSQGAVGTYTWGLRKVNAPTTVGSTASGIFSIQGSSTTINSAWVHGSSSFYNVTSSKAESGTWRAMHGIFGRDDGGGTGFAGQGLWVRIS